MASRVRSPTAQRDRRKPSRGRQHGVVGSGANSRAVAGHDQRWLQRQHPFASGMQRRWILCVRVFSRPVRVPPQVCQRHQTIGSANQGRDVLRRVARGLDELDRRRQARSFGGPIRPLVAVVDRPEVMHPCRWEQRDVHRVIRVMMADDDVGDRTRRDVQTGQWLENAPVVGDHARVDHDDDGAVTNECHRRGCPWPDVSPVQHRDVRRVRHVLHGGQRRTRTRPREPERRGNVVSWTSTPCGTTSAVTTNAAPVSCSGVRA
ncbi:hypothetical protein BH23ACT10_BH23ACT10_08070 [soil metagenome]